MQVKSARLSSLHLRRYMNKAEFTLTVIAELFTRQISELFNCAGMCVNTIATKAGICYQVFLDRNSNAVSH